MAKEETPVTTKSYLGSWDVTVENTPLGTVQGVLMIEEGENGLTGKYVSQGREFPLKSVSTDTDELNTLFYFSDYGVDVPFKLKGAPTSDTLIGTASGEYRVTAARKM